MIENGHIPLHKMILSLSEALDFVCPEIAGHQQRVAYMAVRMGNRMGFSSIALSDLFLAAALHDIGMIRADDRVRAIRDGDMEAVARHGEIGYELLRDKELFERAAPIIRHHHAVWEDGPDFLEEESEVPLASRIVFLADCAELAIDRKVHVLDQQEEVLRRIAEGAGKKFCPECAEAFLDVGRAESFWLDCVSREIRDLLLDLVGDYSVVVTAEIVQEIAEVFARVVDSMSPWTATHSAGVTATATALAELMGFSPREQAYMRTAGLLHDLGKLSVPTRILDKPGKLSREEWSFVRSHTYHTYRILGRIGLPREIIEWAAFHHERLDGKGYPFRHGKEVLTLGSRIMAVADVFTALTEDRPYRRGDSSERAVGILHKMVRDGALDGGVTAILAGNHEYVDTRRREEQAGYALQQERLVRALSGEGIPMGA